MSMAPAVRHALLRDTLASISEMLRKAAIAEDDTFAMSEAATASLLLESSLKSLGEVKRVNDLILD